MPSPLHHGDNTSDDASSRLSDGLRSCRAVLSNYRALLLNPACEEVGQQGSSDRPATREETGD